MAIHAAIATIWTHPKPTVLAVLDSLDEVFANLVGGSPGIAVFRENDVA